MDDLREEARLVAKGADLFRQQGADPGMFYYIGKALERADMENKAIIKKSWPKMWDHYLKMAKEFESFHAKS